MGNPVVMGPTDVPARPSIVMFADAEGNVAGLALARMRRQS